MTKHEKQELVDEGTHEWCEMCGGEGQLVAQSRYGSVSTCRCGDCDGEGIVAVEMFDV